MSKNTKQKRCYTKCKTASNDLNSKNPLLIVMEERAHMLANKIFRILIDSVNFVSDNFDLFGNQMQELIKSMKDIKKEIKILKEQNNIWWNDVNLFEKDRIVWVKIA